MSTVRITLPDGSQREMPRGSTARQVAESIGAGLARAALAARRMRVWFTPPTHSLRAKPARRPLPRPNVLDSELPPTQTAVTLAEYVHFGGGAAGA